MALSFPSSSHRLAAIIDPAHVTECAARKGDLPTISELKARGRRIASDYTKATERLFSVALLADDTIALVSVGRRGGHKIEWRFGA